MSKFLKIIFIIAATSILVEDYCQSILNNTYAVMAKTNESGENDDYEEGEDNNEKKEEKEEKVEGEEKYAEPTLKFKNYDIALKSSLFSTQYTIFLSKLKYKSRCLELESPPPEV